MSAFRERRRYSRADVKWPVTFLAAKDKTGGETEHVGPSGALVSCKDVPPLKENLRIVIKAPGHQPINVSGKVVRSTTLTPSEDSPSYGVGIQFTQISENDLRFLRSLVQNRYVKIDRRRL
ncbi:MAG: PilZ domain-containing protein [Syntrophobacterales bacterium]|jgi:hypothetical protein